MSKLGKYFNLKENKKKKIVGLKKERKNKSIS